MEKDDNNNNNVNKDEKDNEVVNDHNNDDKDNQLDKDDEVDMDDKVDKDNKDDKDNQVDMDDEVEKDNKVDKNDKVDKDDKVAKDKKILILFSMIQAISKTNMFGTIWYVLVPMFALGTGTSQQDSYLEFHTFIVLVKTGQLGCVDNMQPSLLYLPRTVHIYKMAFKFPQLFLLILKASAQGLNQLTATWPLQRLLHVRSSCWVSLVLTSFLHTRPPSKIISLQI